MTTAYQADIVRQAVAAIWNRGELALADGMFAASYRNHQGLITDVVDGPEAVKVSVALFRLAFPALHITVDELIADGDRVVVHWTARAGTPSGSLTGVTICHLSGAQIAESWTYWDQAAMLRQSVNVRHTTGAPADPARDWPARDGTA